MRGELAHALKPYRSRLGWMLFYIILTITVLLAMVAIGNHYHSYRLPSGSVSLQVPYKKYLIGESIAFTLTNNYNSAIYIENECPGEPLAVYRKDGDTWQRIHASADVAKCQKSERQVRVNPQSSRTATFDLWQSLFEKPGTYRIVAYVDYFSAMPYADFEIVDKLVAVVPPPVPKPSASTTSATSTSRRTTTSPTPTPTTPQTQTTATPKPTAPITAQSTTVQAGSSGRVSISYTSSSISVTSISPASGCTYESSGSGPTVEVQFKCGGNETTLKLFLSNGQLVHRLEN